MAKTPKTNAEPIAEDATAKPAVPDAPASAAQTHEEWLAEQAKNERDM